MRADGSQVRQLTRDRLRPAWWPSWSPDGKRIAFTKDVFGGQVLFVMNADGSRQLAVTGGARGFGPFWSRDGRLLFTRTDRANLEIAVIGSDGRGERRLTSNPRADTHPDWSPDGSKIAFESHRGGTGDIYVMDADGGNPRAVFADHDDWEGEPAWAPDGEQLAFSADPDDDNIWSIYIGTRGGTPRRLSSNANDDGFPAWSPDGRQLAFERYQGESSSVYLIDADGRNERRLIGNAAGAAWSPDGSTIAFSSDRRGDGLSIWTIDVQSGSTRRLTSTAADDYSPA